MGISESKYAKDLSIRDEHIKRLETRLEEITMKVDNADARIEKVEVSNNGVVSGLEETNKRFEEISRHFTADSKSNREVWEAIKEENRKNQEHRERIERMLCNFGRERFPLSSPATIDEWIGNVQKAVYISVIDEQKISQIRKCISPAHIKMVGRHLGLRDNDVCEIEVDCRHLTASETAYQILIKWKNKMGQKATIRSLTECLFEAAKEDPTSINVESLTDALLMSVNLRRPQ